MQCKQPVRSPCRGDDAMSVSHEATAIAAPKPAVAPVIGIVKGMESRFLLSARWRTEGVDGYGYGYGFWLMTAERQTGFTPRVGYVS
jgi:hypothetical protein